MLSKAPTIYKIIIFIYVLAIPFYGTYLVPAVRTVVLIPILFIPFVDISRRYFPLLKLDVIKWFACYLLFCLFTCFFVSSLDSAVDQFIDYFVDLLFLVIFVIIASSSISTLKIIFYALILGLTLSIALGYLQHFSIDLFKIQDEDSINTNTLDNAISRAGGPFGNSLTYSNYLSVVGIIVIVIFLKKKSAKYIYLALLSYFLIIVALIFSGGRTGIVIFQIAFTIAFFILTNNKFILVLAFLAFVVAVATYSDKILKIPTISRFVNSSDDLKNVRWKNNWAYGFRIVGESPFVGTGMGNLNYRLIELKAPYVPASRKFKQNGHLESVFITIIATYGTIGLVLFLIWIIIITIKMIRTISILRGTVFSNYLVACLFGWLVFLVNMMTNPAFIFDVRIMFLFMILAASPYVIDSYFTKKKFSILTI